MIELKIRETEILQLMKKFQDRAVAVAIEEKKLGLADFGPVSPSPAE